MSTSINAWPPLRVGGALQVTQVDDTFCVPESEVDFLETLAGPTAFRVEGRDTHRTRVFVALLHGNEPSSFRAVHRFLRSRQRPAVNLVCVVGAVDAARHAPHFSARMLPGRRDLNRCFRAPFEGRDGDVARAILEELARLRPEAVVDVHNNTGHNPAYGIGVHGSDRHLALASLFADRYVLSNLQLGALMEVVLDETPIISVECGRAGDPVADQRAIAGLVAFAEADELPRVPASPLQLYAHPRRVTLKEGLRLAFAETPREDVDVTFTHNVDQHNFSRLGPGTRIGWSRHGSALPLQIRDHRGDDIAHEYFEMERGQIVTCRPCIPIMMTTQAKAALDDCLFYVVSELGPNTK